MISDLMAVHNAFMNRFEHHVLGTHDVPVRFFNEQPKMKQAPVYPSLIVTAFIPKFGKFAWVSDTKIMEGDRVRLVPPPNEVVLRYQVDARANRFDDINELFLWLLNAIEEQNGVKQLQVGDDTVDCAITDTREVPDLDMGVFQWSFTYSIRIPLFDMPRAKVATLVSEFTTSVEADQS